MEHSEFESRSENQDTAALSRKVYNHLLKQIIEVKLEPGKQINVAKIASELGVSRTPLRSAMDQLVRDGLVQRLSARGYQVTPISMVDCFDLCDARKILEGTAAYMAANNAKSTDIEILERSIVDARECLSRQQYSDFAEQDALFHETLLRAANNHYLFSIYDTIKIRISRYRYIICTYCRGSVEQDTGHAITKHSCIFRAVKNRYSSVARNEMEAHIAYTYRTLFGLGQFISKK
jgi:DNA-binding GntR family transcriptional regulator